MFKSTDVAVNPSNSCSTVLILGIGNGFRTSHLFTSLKSLIKRTVWSFLGIMKEGPTDAGWNSNTPKSHSLFNSFIVVSLRDFGTGDGLLWYGLVPTFNSKETGSVFESPSVPSKSSSNSVSNSSNLFWSCRLRWVQLVLTTDWRSACHIWHLGYELLFGLLHAYLVVCVPCCYSPSRPFPFLTWSDYWCLSLATWFHQL